MSSIIFTTIIFRLKLSFFRWFVNCDKHDLSCQCQPPFCACFFKMLFDFDGSHITPNKQTSSFNFPRARESGCKEKWFHFHSPPCIFFTLEAWYMIFFQAAKNKLAQNLSKKMKFANFNIRLLFSANHNTVEKKETFLA